MRDPEAASDLIRLGKSRWDVYRIAKTGQIPSGEGVIALPTPCRPASAASNRASQRRTARLAKLHVFTALSNTQSLLFDHLSHLDLEARTEVSCFT